MHKNSRLIIVVVQLGIYVAAVEALWRKERQDETQFTTKIDVRSGERKDRTKLSLPPKLMRSGERKDRMKLSFTTKFDGFLSFIPPLNANVLFCWFFFC